MKICVLGSGTWGSSVAKLLNENGNEVSLWSYFEEEAEKLRTTHKHLFLENITMPEDILYSSSMQECIEGVEVIILATPSHTIRQTATTLSKIIKKDQIITIISKGIEEGTFLRLSQIVKELIPDNIVSVMSGPSHAEEVAIGLPTTNVIACEDIEIARNLQEAFMNEKFRIYTTSDVIGVEVGGALKNVIALCAGISDGLGYGDNTKAALMTRGIAEITRLGVALGGKSETFAGLSGIGDLIVTCTSMHSRNRRAGILLGQGKSLDEAQAEVKMVVEGVKTTLAAYGLSKKMNVEMPIVNEAYSVLFENKPAMEAVNSLMSRDRIDEQGGRA
ncbi:MAG: NAD(P)H-dependent glycerol-3-phosphate dehydrogenase [Eubacteriales bacterium]|nr:NAD(P)H-dependent glycerol-3-phosphate dehydrogenase [Eubacteriales bacterium]